MIIKTATAGIKNELPTHMVKEWLIHRWYKTQSYGGLDMTDERSIGRNPLKKTYSAPWC